MRNLRNTFIRTAAVAALACTWAQGAAAHVTLEEPQALAGRYHKATLQVGHGCDGSPVHTLAVRVPEGLRGAKPMPKPGWALSIRKDRLAQPYQSHGKTISEDVVEIVWKATSRDSWLQDGWYDTFVLRGQLPAQAGNLWFKVLQTCEQGAIDWAEVPANGSSTKGLKAPAALLEVLADEHAGHHH
jgi:uncharacterized protein YcnI